ncbi:sigma-70 family RNA polymerase sigma factor [Actinospica durhamensis]|uniref:Sigma-70 family RNA polymerase sigma factor n=1 Tax=Actinospica durhamensis TaxID=1508375 RepID=A0A941EK14_9ACTN|nr:sigma-70 family RNA polymerase sigma factor [Actinospica durhamensis]MBR7832283.1 sigma-70 family RNA polymerase sigma factor [Actinospica durhamensis]
MSDRDLVAALRAGDRLAAGQVYDIYGTRLYAYCHELLADPKLSADALRDTFIVAVSRIRELGEPEEFGAWLYALARNECIRVGISDDAPADAAGAARGDRLARLALDCYSMLEPDERELLDLAYRHRLVDSDLALVLGLDESQISSKVTTAQAGLETSLLVVLAARTGDPKCAEAAEFGRRFDDIDGKGVPGWLQGAARHVERCTICGDAVRNRRPLRLFEELPHSFMPPGVRSRVLEALRDPAGTAFAEQIAERGGRFDEAGFPTAGGSKISRGRKWALPLGGVVVAAAAVAAIIMFLNGKGHPADAADTIPTGTSTVSTQVSGTTSATFSELSLPSSSASGSASASVSASSSSPVAQQQQSSSAPQQQQSSSAPAQKTTPPTHTPTPTHSTTPPHSATPSPPASTSSSPAASATPSSSSS